MSRRQRDKRGKQWSARLAGHLRGSDAMQKLGEIGAEFIRSQLRRPSPSSPRAIKLGGRWKDHLGIVHAVNILFLAFADHVDLGRETACGSTFWDPDSPRLYPVPAAGEVDCMACVACGSLG